MNSKFTKRFHLKILRHFPLCLTYVSMRFCLSTATSPMPLIFGSNFKGCALYSGAGWVRVKHQVTYIQGCPLKFCAWLDFLFAIFVCSLLHCKHSHTKLFHHFYFVCMLNLGYTVHMFHITDAKYVMFCVGWSKPLKGSVTPDECITTVCGSKCFKI